MSATRIAASQTTTPRHTTFVHLAATGAALVGRLAAGLVAAVADMQLGPASDVDASRHLGGRI